MSSCGKIKALVIAGAASNSGKTTVSLALMAALKKKGLNVAAFKIGPDFIDPGHHARVLGDFSHNLDGWMLSKQENQQIFQRYTQNAQVVIVEGVMGLYDGFDPKKDDGSTAQMAKWLDLPVVLVVNAKAMARSLAALAKGFAGFDPELKFAGLLANNAGSPNHIRILNQVMELTPEMPFLGGLLKNSDISLPSRHLGLVTAEEGGFNEENIETLANWLETSLDLDQMLCGLPKVEIPYPIKDNPQKEKMSLSKVRLGVAKDKAFCFYYEENLRRLREQGAELVFFSPLKDEKLPPDLNGLYIGGGYPELFAEELSQNQTIAQQISQMGKNGAPIYAECGGMMYLGEELLDLEGNSWPMTGLLPIQTKMLNRLRSLGYRKVVLTKETVLGPKGTVIKGHEFHYSEVINEFKKNVTNAYEVTGRKGPMPNTLGYCFENTLASYVHLHFGSNPTVAENFVTMCRN